MSFSYEERLELFKTKLKEDEEVLWMGESQDNWWNLLFLIAFIAFLGIVLFSFYYLVQFFIYSFSEIHDGEEFLAPAIVIFYFLIGLSPIIRKFKTELVKEHFAITNQRVLIYNFGKVTAYSLILLADAIKHKPKRGTTTISLYDKTSSTGKMPEPITALNNLSETDAEIAYDLLRNVHEERLLERVAELEEAQLATR